MEATSNFTRSDRSTQAAARFRTLPIDQEFVRRSATYLASKGYRTGEIHDALVEQFEISAPFADEVLSKIAA